MIATIVFRNPRRIGANVVLRCIHQRLERSRATVKRVGVGEILFTAGLSHALLSNNPLCLVPRGKVSITQKSDCIVVRYEFWTYQMLILSIGVSCFLGLAGFAYDHPPRQPAALIATFCVLFYVANLLFARSGVARMIRDCWKQCEEEAGSSGDTYELDAVPTENPIRGREGGDSTPPVTDERD